MDSLCNSPLWQYNLTWNTTDQPDFTPCFQETFLIWFPCLLLWIIAPLEIISIYKSERKYIPITLLNLFKTFLTTVLVILSFAELIEAFVNSNNEVPMVEYVTPLVKSVTYILVFFMNALHRNRGVHTSGLMFIFWLLMSVASIINLRSLIIYTVHDHSTNVVHSTAEWNITESKFTIRLVSVPIVIIELILSCFADKRASDPFIISGEDYRHHSPENDASILSQITFWWLNSFMILGYKRTLEQEDLYSIKPCERTEMITSRFNELLIPKIQKALDERKNQNISSHLHANKGKSINGATTDEKNSWIPLLNKRNKTEGRKQKIDNKHESSDDLPTEQEDGLYVGVATIIMRAFWSNLILASTFKLMANLLTFASPILLGRLIHFVSDANEPNWRGGLYAALLFFLSVAQSIFDNREQYMTNVNVMRIKTCLTAAVYGKTLRLSNQGRRRYTTGEIVNLMSVDSQKVADFVMSVNNLWSAPVQLAISMAMLYQQLGIAIFAGLGIMLINIPLNVKITGKLGYFQRLVMREKDKRIKLLSEIINGMKIIKIHAWEESFRKRTESIRANEIKSLISQTWYSAGITFSFTCLPFLVALTSFATYVLIDSNNVLDASTAFVSLSLFNIMRVPLAILPMLLSNLASFKVSTKRVNKFLESDETDPDMIEQIDDETNVIKIKDGTFKWEATGDNILERINLEVPRRKLVAVVGSIGSGKSSLISAILGDLEKCNGRVMVDKGSTMAYVPQEAWVLNTTFKNNIMFNKVVNEEKYQRVLEACALTPDLKTLEQGDSSEIGEKGINLSGGQKQRVSLARAVYADTDIYLLDDPLNAVDAHVGRHIFDHIIGPKGMLRDRTRLLVTNKLSLLPEVDYIVVLKDGKISESGTYERLLRDRGLFSQLLVRYLLENTDKGQIPESIKADVITKELKRLEESQAQKDRDESPVKVDLSGKPSTLRSEAKSVQDVDVGIRGLTGNEVTQVGSVGLNVHINFIRTMGINFIIALALYILSSVFTLSSSIWLSAWSNDALDSSLTNNTTQRDLRLGVYAGLGFGESICIITSTILLNLACIRSSQMLHNRMLGRVLQAPMWWFNTTPSGRIINRFAKDIDVIDVNIRFNVRLLMIIALRSITSLILISIGSVYSIIMVIPIVLLYFLFQMFYISTSRQLKRIESITRSPIYSHFSETITGISSIRAFNVGHEFILESNHRVDVNNASYYIGFVAARWLAIRLEFLGFIVVLTASLVAILSRNTISPGIAGLSVTYSLTVTQVLSFLVRTYSDYETNVVSVERLLEYTRTPLESDQDDIPSDPDWPAKGQIVYDNYSTRYRSDLELVLDGLNLKVNPSEKIGLVGRTGAGKSSVTLALFRIIEPVGGRIVIDDVDISHINLKILRSKLSIIPQEPILFTGTIRQNIDPCENYPDHEIWRAVELAHMGSFLRSLPDGLDHQVSEGGGNFSVGQKQLFCLARTLLRRSKILILDEATAAVDVETDNLIQQTIRREFSDSTIITIAHRIETIQDYDRVAVLDRGRVSEEVQYKLIHEPWVTTTISQTDEHGCSVRNKLVLCAEWLARTPSKETMEEELDDYNSIMNGRELDRLEILRSRLEYFFMDPLQKWRRKNTRPWKLLVQILKIIIFTTQLVIFGQDMAKFINYKEEMQVTLRQLLLKDWDPSANAVAYPGPFVPYAVYTKSDFIKAVNYAVRIYSDIGNIAVGQYGYQSNQTKEVSAIELCSSNYIKADFDPTRSSYNYSILIEKSCKVIDNFAPPGDERWQKFDFREHLNKTLNFTLLVSTSVKLPLRTLLMEDATTGYAEIVCFDIDVDILFDNRHRIGQIVIDLNAVPKRIECHGTLVEAKGGKIGSRLILNLTVMLFCLISFTLCIRSLWRSFVLMRSTEIVFRSHGKKLDWDGRLEFVDFWLVLIVVNDLMVFLATSIITFYNGRLLETDNYTTCSLLLGLGNFLSWLGLLRYLSFFKKYNLLIVTLRKSFVHVLRFMLCTTIIYCGFCFCGWIIFGPYHFKFRELSTTTECLFALINGDDMFETFALLRSNIGPIWWLSRVYLYVFVSLFIYVVLSLFIALIMDAYEIIKQFSDNGFPKTRLENFYLAGDLSKLNESF